MSSFSPFNENSVAVAEKLVHLCFSLTSRNYCSIQESVYLIFSVLLNSFAWSPALLPWTIKITSWYQLLLTESSPHTYCQCEGENCFLQSVVLSLRVPWASRSVDWYGKSIIIKTVGMIYHEWFIKQIPQFCLLGIRLSKLTCVCFLKVAHCPRKCLSSMINSQCCLSSATVLAVA